MSGLGTHGEEVPSKEHFDIFNALFKVVPIFMFLTDV